MTLEQLRKREKPSKAELLAALAQLAKAVDNASSVRGTLTGAEGRALEEAQRLLAKEKK